MPNFFSIASLRSLAIITLESIVVVVSIRGDYLVEGGRGSSSSLLKLIGIVRGLGSLGGFVD